MMPRIQNYQIPKIILFHAVSVENRKLLFVGNRCYVKGVNALVDGNAEALGFPIPGLCTFAGTLLMAGRVLHLLV